MFSVWSAPEGNFLCRFPVNFYRGIESSLTRNTTNWHSCMNKCENLDFWSKLLRNRKSKEKSICQLYSDRDYHLTVVVSDSHGHRVYFMFCKCCLRTICKLHPNHGIRLFMFKPNISLLLPHFSACLSAFLIKYWAHGGNLISLINKAPLVPQASSS